MISIVGCGHVGSVIAYTFGLNRINSKILLYDIQKERLLGELKDLSHCNFKGVEFILADEFDYIARSDIIIITAGAKRKAKESRLDLIKKNVAIIKELIDKLNKLNSAAKLIIITNPVDILTYLAQKWYSPPNLDSKRITLGLGTYVDTLRLKSLLKEKFRREDIFLPIIGEHGDSMVPLLSQMRIGDKSLKELSYAERLKVKEAKEEIVSSGAYLIETKGGANFAIAAATLDIVNTLLGKKKSKCIILSSSFSQKNYGLSENIAISLPYILSTQGIEKIVRWNISEEEELNLKESAKIIENYIEKCENIISL